MSLPADPAPADASALLPDDLSRLVAVRLQAALGAHQAGRLDEAALLYRHVLAIEPGHAGVLHMLGLVTWRRGDLQHGIALMGRAWRTDSRASGLPLNLGNALRELLALARARLDAGLDEAAAALCGQGLAVRPDDLDLAHTRAVALWRAGRTGDAIRLAEALRRRAEADAPTRRRLETLRRDAGEPQPGELADRGVIETGRFFGALHVPPRTEPTVLVAVEGEWHQWLWGQVALAFHHAGARVVLVRIQPGCFRELAAAGGYYDLAICNQAAMNHFLFDVRNAPDLEWGRHFHSFAIFQFHDVCSELFTLACVDELRQRYGFQFRYWAFCRASEAFLRKHVPQARPFFCPPPLSGEELVVYDPAFGRTQNAFELSSGHIGRVDAFLAGGAGRERPGTAGRGIYFGAYEDGLTFRTNPEAPLKPADLAAHARAYRTAGDPTRIGFMDWLLETGRATTDPQQSRSLTTLGEYLWIHARGAAFEERGRPVQRIKQRFGDRVWVFGDNWGRLGVEHLPPDFAIWPFSYAAAKVCIDFGSQYIDSCLYPRTLQVIGFGGRLLQRRKYDSDLVYGRHASSVCFDDEDDLLSRLEAILDEPDAAPDAAWRAANADLLRALDPAGVAARVLSIFFGAR